MRYLFCLILFIVCAPLLQARTLEVGPGKAFARLQAAATQAKPGDVILIRAGLYGGNDFIKNLQGTAKAWITIKAAPKEQVIFRGGSHAFQLSNPAYVRIEGLQFEGQTANGVNIDDGGTYQASAHHVIIENCHWRNMAASGNNDEIKLSGLEDFTIRKCRFTNGSPGGSLLDMVGCHNGVIEDNIFENGGATGIQAKGGTKNITIQRNRFTNCGERAINIGGTTGLTFFRPQGATYEAANIYVWSNIFTGTNAPFAFVGSVDCEVVNNTIIRPKRWALRILQENINPGFQACGRNKVINNIFVLTSTNQPVINIGSNTAPGTFVFANNLWFNPEGTGTINPQTPAPETDALVNVNPAFADSLYLLQPNSPANGKGQAVSGPKTDFYGKPFRKIRSVGAVEAAGRE